MDNTFTIDELILAVTQDYEDYKDYPDDFLELSDPKIDGPRKAQHFFDLMVANRNV